jgi:hypothetical protein
MKTLRENILTQLLHMIEHPFAFSFIFWTLIFTIVLCVANAHATVNLIEVCKDATPPTATNCISPVYDIPKPTDMVKGAGGYYAQWALFVGPTAVAVVCPADIPAGTQACPTTPVTVPATQVAVSSVPVGALRLTWTHDGMGVDNLPTTLTGFWIYSAASGATLAKLKQITDGAARSADLPGYATPGTYTFALSAVNASGESALSPPAVITITAPPVKVLPKAPAKPTAVKLP